MATGHISLEISFLNVIRLDLLPAKQATMTSTTPSNAGLSKKIKAIQASIQATLNENGVTLAEVFPEAVSKRRGPKPGTRVAPKYQHPTQPEVTWSGRGKTPVWLRTLEQDGRAREEFRILPAMS